MMVIQMMALRCTLVTMGLTQTLGVRVGYGSTEFHGSTKDRDRISLTYNLSKHSQISL
jgi:hypothetical protein